jgi:hypothetical protein
MYQQASEGAGAGAPGGDAPPENGSGASDGGTDEGEVVDAEFEEVDKDKE